MIEYMVAVTLGNLISPAIEYNVDLPEWGLTFDAALHQRLRDDPSRTLIVRDSDASSILAILQRTQESSYQAIIFEGFFQRTDLLYAPDFYRPLFPFQPDTDELFTDDELVINIRAGELRNGVGWYPLVPPDFYANLIDRTGLRPVLIGQLDDCHYIDEVRSRLPSARSIPSAGPKIDFNRVRNAKKLCMAVSTFSWLATWLSTATEIHYPLLGFLHPHCFRPGTHGLGGINLVPADDARYRFHLFPSIRGEEQHRYLSFVNKIAPISKEVPRSQVALLRSQNSILPRRTSPTAVDENWYIKSNISAAWEISEGWYYDASHHYVEIGHQRGLKPNRPPYHPLAKNVALNKKASQSSISVWSVGSSIEDDASRALDGDNDKEIAFHTDFDDYPWWMVDLQNTFLIECVNIYNRRNIDAARIRISPFVLEVSLNGSFWYEILKTSERFDFGSMEGPNPPLQWVADRHVEARWVRIRVLKLREVLHLAGVEVFGTTVEAP